MGASPREQILEQRMQTDGGLVKTEDRKVIDVNGTPYANLTKDAMQVCGIDIGDPIKVDLYTDFVVIRRA